MSLLQLIVGGLMALVVAGAAWRQGALAGSGALAAAVVGGLSFGVGGWQPAVLLLAFFLSSSGLSFVGRDRKRALVDHAAKGARRDWAQVAANGGLAALLAVGFGLHGDPFWLAGLTGALAAATADTWATELGVLASGPPRMITSGRISEPGTSGAVTWQGVLASLAGGAFLGGVASLLRAQPSMLLLGALAGLVGSLVDSLLGATLQARYRCPACQRATEQHPRHLRCGEATERSGGLAWLDNDGVNLAATAVGAACAGALWLWL